MKSILDKLYTGTAETLVEDIIDTYQENGSCIVNFIYFANIVAQRLFENNKTYPKKIGSCRMYPSGAPISIFKEYKQSLLKSDFLLPDGIALQVYYFLANIFKVIHSPKRWLDNLNGTDFIPYFLQEVKKKYGNQKICLLLYGSTEYGIQKASEHISYKGYNVIHYQHGYKEFEREKVNEVLEDYQDTINILLVGMTMPTIPIQELWTKQNLQKIQDAKLVVCNVGGFFDRWAGLQKRPPKWVRTIKCEWLWRFISQPKRNAKKVRNSLKIIPYIFRYLILKKE